MACNSNQEPIVSVQLRINGAEIELNNFVKNCISQTVSGMVTSLRGVSNIETIELKISKKVKSSQEQ
jgi:hypothetical protein